MPTLSAPSGHRAPGPGGAPDAPGPGPESGAVVPGLLILFLVALLVRLVHAWELRGTDAARVLVGDAYVYDRWAQDVAGGHWLGDAVFYQAPLYPYFLAAIYSLIAPSLIVVRFVQALLGAATCLLLALAGRALFSARIGLIAGGILACYAPAVFFGGLIQKTVLDLFLMTLLLWLLTRLPPRPGPGGLAAAGLALGLLCLTRENALVLIGAVGAWLGLAFTALSRARRAGAVALFLAGVALALGPVAVRNRLVGGEWLPTTAQLGPNLYIGNHARANGLYAPLRWDRGDARLERQDATELAEAALRRRLTPGEVSRYWVARTLADVREAPLRWLRLLGRKLALTWNRHELVDSDDPAVYADASGVLRALTPLVHFGTVAPLAMVGVWASRREWRRLWILYLILASVTASVVLFYVFGRYRASLVPALAIVAAAGLSAGVEAWKARRWRELSVALALLAGGATVVNWPLVEEPLARAVMYRNMGATLAREGRPSDAVRYFGKAVSAAPAYVEARLSLARTLAALGRRDEAIGEYLMALSLRPGLPEAESALARLLLGTAPGSSGPAPPR